MSFNLVFKCLSLNEKSLSHACFCWLNHFFKPFNLQICKLWFFCILVSIFTVSQTSWYALVWRLANCRGCSLTYWTSFLSVGNFEYPLKLLLLWKQDQQFCKMFIWLFCRVQTETMHSVWIFGCRSFNSSLTGRCSCQRWFHQSSPLSLLRTLRNAVCSLERVERAVHMLVTG